jgi:excisionase family DNA binding protein
MSEPMLISLDQVSDLIGKSRRGVYQLIATDQIRAVKSGRNTLVVYESLKQFVDNLPAMKCKPYVAKNAVRPS